MSEPSFIDNCGRLAEYLETEPQRLAAKAEAERAKLEALERKLGMEKGSFFWLQFEIGRTSSIGGQETPLR